MNWKSVATIGVVSGTIVTLLATASPSIDRHRQAVAPTAAIDTQQGAALIVETAKLRERVGAPTPLSASRRNPFAFGEVTAASDRARDEAAELLLRRSSMEFNRPLPPFTLVGLAEDRTADGTVLTAILSSPGALRFVKQGDRVDGGYRVSAVTSDSVELADESGHPLLLRLK
jgi:hypothetical protein